MLHETCCCCKKFSSSNWIPESLIYMFFYVANVNFIYCGRSFIQVDRVHINRPLQISGCLRRRRVRRRRGGGRYHFFGYIFFMLQVLIYDTSTVPMCWYGIISCEILIVRIWLGFRMICPSSIMIPTDLYKFQLGFQLMKG